MKTIKVILCNCGEDIFEDDYSREVDGIEYLGCINCGKEYPKSSLKEEEVVDITKETV